MGRRDRGGMGTEPGTGAGARRPGLGKGSVGGTRGRGGAGTGGPGSRGEWGWGQGGAGGLRVGREGERCRGTGSGSMGGSGVEEWDWSEEGMGTRAAAPPSLVGAEPEVKVALSVLGLGQVRGPSPRWARGTTDPPTRAGGEGWPRRAQGVWSQQRCCTSPGQGRCHLPWVPHIAQHLGWALDCSTRCCTSSVTIWVGSGAGSAAMGAEGWREETSSLGRSL